MASAISTPHDSLGMRGQWAGSLPFNPLNCAATAFPIFFKSAIVQASDQGFFAASVADAGMTDLFGAPGDASSFPPGAACSLSRGRLMPTLTVKSNTFF